jgi:hypothetical protein
VEVDRTHLWHFSHETLRKLLGEFFLSVSIHPVDGRFRVLSRALLSNLLLFTAHGIRRRNDVHG